MVDSKRGDFADEFRSIKHFFDFRGTHPIAGSLDHLVLASDKVEESILVHAYRVARKDGHLGHDHSWLAPTDTDGQRLVALGGLLSVVPVPHAHQGASVYEF